MATRCPTLLSYCVIIIFASINLYNMTWGEFPPEIDWAAHVENIFLPGSAVVLPLAQPPSASRHSGQSSPRHSRLLHSPSLLAIWLSVGYETRLVSPFEIGWSKYSLGLPSAPLHYGLKWPVGIPTVFQTLAIVPLHCPDGRQVPAVRAVQGDCERVYGHSCLSCPSRQEFEGILDASKPARSGTPGSTTHTRTWAKWRANIKTVLIDGIPIMK